MLEWLIPILIGAAVGAAVFLLVLKKNDIWNWLRQQKEYLGLGSKNKVKYGSIIREKLDSGKVKVVSGVFTKKSMFHKPELLEAKEWVADELDSDLEKLLNGKDSAIIKVREF